MFSKEEINNVFWLLKHPVGIVKKNDTKQCKICFRQLD